MLQLRLPILLKIRCHSSQIKIGMARTYRNTSLPPAPLVHITVRGYTTRCMYPGRYRTLDGIRSDVQWCNVSGDSQWFLIKLPRIRIHYSLWMEPIEVEGATLTSRNQ
jgi:hypothetical protein